MNKKKNKKRLSAFLNFKLLNTIKITGGSGEGGPIDPPIKPRPSGDDGTTR